MHILVIFNHKQVIIDSIKCCTSTVATDGSEDLLIDFLKPNQPCAAGLDRIKRLHHVVLRETGSFWDSWGTDKYIYWKEWSYLTLISEKLRWFPHNIRAIMAKIKLPKNPHSMVIFWTTVRRSYEDLSSQADPARENWTWSFIYLT